MGVKLLFATIFLLSLESALVTTVRYTVHAQLSQKGSGSDVSDGGEAFKPPFLIKSATQTPTPTPSPPPPPPVRSPNTRDRGGVSKESDRDRDSRGDRGRDYRSDRVGTPPAKAANQKVRAAFEQSAKAARVLNQIMESREKSIPRDLLDRAEAVAVFPGVSKNGFIVGGRGGSGVISRRVPGGWSAPAFFELGGGSLGLQIEVASSDYILLFMNMDSVENLLKDRFEIGGEGSVTAGPVGRSASASTDVRLNAQILSYSRSKGAFAGLELKDVVIKPEDEENRRIYGMNAREIISRASKLSFAIMPEGMRAFPATLSRYSTRR